MNHAWEVNNQYIWLIFVLLQKYDKHSLLTIDIRQMNILKIKCHPGVHTLEIIEVPKPSSSTKIADDGSLKFCI